MYSPLFRGFRTRYRSGETLDVTMSAAHSEFVELMEEKLERTLSQMGINVEELLSAVEPNISSLIESAQEDQRESVSRFYDQMLCFTVFEKFGEHMEDKVLELFGIQISVT